MVSAITGQSVLLNHHMPQTSGGLAISVIQLAVHNNGGSDAGAIINIQEILHILSPADAHLSRCHGAGPFFDYDFSVKVLTEQFLHINITPVHLR